MNPFFRTAQLFVLILPVAAAALLSGRVFAAERVAFEDVSDSSGISSFEHHSYGFGGDGLAGQVIHYPTDIQPIFNAKCVSCHGKSDPAGWSRGRS